MTTIDSVAGYLQQDGITFRYIREGAGQPILVIGSSIYYPRTFSPDLRTHFELIFVDSRHFIPAYQPTRKELESLSLEKFADDIEALRIHLGIDRWTVLGHSVHAQIALAYAGKYPRRITNIIIVAGVPYSSNDLDPLLRSFWEMNASQERKEQHKANRRAIESALAKASEAHRPIVDYIGDAALLWADPTYDSTPLWKGVEINPAFNRLFEILPPRTQVLTALESMVTPTMLILGELDYIIPHTAWEELIKKLPLVKYCLIEKVGHTPMLENPDIFDRAIMYWMKG